MKLNLKTSKWYSLHRFAPKLSNIWVHVEVQHTSVQFLFSCHLPPRLRMETGRRLHACTKVTLNGRPGLVVSGGVSSASKNLTRSGLGFIRLCYNWQNFGFQTSPVLSSTTQLQASGQPCLTCRGGEGGTLWRCADKNLFILYTCLKNFMWISKRSHAMLVHNGRLTVTGGVQADGSLLGDSEEFDGRR